MKVKLRHDAELETLTEHELESVLERVLGEKFPTRLGPQIERPRDGVACDANGNGTVKLYEVPVGMTFSLTSIYITADGHSPASRASSGYATLNRGVNGVELDSYDFTVTGNGIPMREKYTGDAPHFHEREIVVITFADVGASLNVVVQGQGVLEPIVGVV